MGGWNTKSVMSPNLLVVDRNKQAGASPCDRATLPYHSYTTTIPQISLLYHSIIIPQFFCAGRLWFMLPTDVRELLAIVRPSPAGVRITLFPEPAVLRLWPTRKTLAQRYARWPRRISLRDGAQRDRAYAATGGLHTFARTRQRRRGCAQQRRAQGEWVAGTRNLSCRRTS